MDGQGEGREGEQMSISGGGKEKEGDNREGEKEN